MRSEVRGHGHRRRVGRWGNATQISGLSTDLQNDSGPLGQARDAAFNDAKAKAAQYAKSEGAASNAVPIEPGSTDVTVQVTVVFSFA
ncbi:SIMPL domain-containing protein [Catenulispora acidiphila]|uniref:SIMPL domain-containing protein n=1 Tax=Catenulispora acidiphila TaxID=304895 RepID=UPI00167FDEEE|nr:SIMPL domain-containing protein [Catenulispora acidiphila]